jgi:hypothetical protein
MLLTINQKQSNFDKREFTEACSNNIHAFAPVKFLQQHKNNAYQLDDWLTMSKIVLRKEVWQVRRMIWIVGSRFGDKHVHAMERAKKSQIVVIKIIFCYRVRSGGPT